ncbi:MAG: Acyl-coenzyme A thioesterase PaaI [Candidatus Hydrogenedentes bacterium ADurb.Bin101]|nr:MAG: Acyl-coenzyme A thioesterase PaaI [Candidatus Hydrogenedentes bacterium ADurb.Bin101]HOH28897.1 PaaI family thioesterase [Candidatus Hydrogenedentota bacterium]
MDILQEYFKGDNLAAALNMKIEQVEPGRAVVSMPVSAIHMNGMGAVHGGAIFSLADFCFAVASNSHGRAAMAINCSISFFKGIKSGTLTATAHEQYLGNRIAGYLMEVTDEKGALVASMQAQVYRTQETIESILATRDGEADGDNK